MKLNADIVFSCLAKHFQCEMHGPVTKDMTLNRVEFYLDGETSFIKNHLYLASIDHLPQRPNIQRGSVLVCIGDSFTLNYYRERMTVILIKKKIDYFRVYQLLQDAFDNFALWETTLYKDLASEHDISKLINDSKDIFQKPIYVLDSSIKIIASTEPASSSWEMTDSGSLTLDSMGKYLSASDVMFDRKDAMLLDIFGIKTLCVNLFNRDEQYEGCLCINCGNADFVSGEDKLAEHLAEIIELAIVKNPNIINDSQSSIKKVMQSLIEEMPLSRSQRMVLTGSNKKNNYVCLFLRYGKNNNRLPLSYICDVFEESFDDSYAFIKDDHVVGIVNIDRLSEDSKTGYQIVLNSKLGEFVRQMHLCVGISNEFSDLYNIKVHYMQAMSAVENGLLMDSEAYYFYFSSYALTQMIVNSLGGLPVQAYFPHGLNSLIEHDRTSGVSYLETLKVFLEENMSYTSTAQKLYIHRSTLIDRIARIEKEMNIDLEDYDQRLQLEILLKAIDLEEALRQQ